MPTVLKEKALWFNDVVIVPQLGIVRSRKEIKPEFHRFIASCMTAVVGSTFARAATDIGITVCIPRFLGIEKEVDIYHNCANKTNLYLSMGLSDLKRVSAFAQHTDCQNYLIDIASGYLPHIEDTVKLLVDKTSIKNIILGNITTVTGFHYLAGIAKKYGLNCIIRCGLSNGSGCQTYSNVGVGSGAFSELVEISPYKSQYNNVYLASDGGLKDGGYISKSLLAGSDFCFIGGAFAKALEAEAHISGDGTYYGLASDKNQILSTGKKYRHSEGCEYKIDTKELKPLREIVDEIWGCVSSAVSYSGFSSLSDAIGQGTFQVKLNSLPPRKRY